jgi:protein involved in ribonucleotide reduction
MAAAEADCRAAGYREMELRFINHRDNLHRFYLRLGFHDTGVQEFPHPARMKIPFPFVQMTKALLLGRQSRTLSTTAVVSLCAPPPWENS